MTMDDEDEEEDGGYQFTFPPYCSHGYPMDLIETPDPNRPGWLRGECRLCHRFVGYRNTVVQEKKKASYE